MANPLIPDVVGTYGRGFAVGQQQAEAKRRNLLAGIASQAFGAPEEQRGALVQQAVGIDPDAGFGLDKQLRMGDDAREAQLLNSARMIDAAPEPLKNAIFQQVKPRIAQHLPGLPDAYNEQVGQGIKAFIASRTNTGATPAGFQEFDMKARAAGLLPGTPEYQSAANIALGREGRASNAALQTVEVERPDGGVDRYTFDPRTGRYVPFGAGMGAPPGVMIDPSLPQNVQDAIRANPQAFAAAPDGGTVQAGPQFIGGAGRGISAADKAAAETLARQQAEMSLLPQRGRLEAENEGLKTAAREKAEAQAQKLAALPQTIASADETVALLDRVLNHPGRTSATGLSSINPMNRIPGTDAYDFNVLLDQIKGQSFLQAFQSLKGGGAITEREGQAATNAIARLNAAQSEGEFVNAINDLKRIVSQGRTRAIQSASGAQASPQERPALPPGFSWED